MGLIKNPLLMAMGLVLLLLLLPAPGAGRLALQAAETGASPATAPPAATRPVPASPVPNERPPSPDISEWAARHPAQARGFAIALLATLAITVTMLLRAGRSASPPYITRLSASFFFWLEMGYLVLLLIGAGFYLQVMPAKQPPQMVGGILPIGVPWFGALGAVVISLEGIFAYGQRNWDPKYNYWHIGRPLFGAVLGIVAFFTYLLIIMSAGAYPPFISGDSTPVAKDFIVYYVVAFLVGYREETFRELIRRVTDLILKPQPAAASAPVVTFKKDGVVIASWDFGAVVAPATSSLRIQIENSGFVALRSPRVSLETAAGSALVITADGLTGSDELKPGEQKAVDIRFAPAAAGAHYAAVLSVAADSLSAPARLTLSGRG